MTCSGKNGLDLIHFIITNLIILTRDDLLFHQFAAPGFARLLRVWCGGAGGDFLSRGLQLGFACWPLVRMTGDAKLMGAFVAPRWILVLGWIATAMVVSASLWFVAGVF